MVGLRFAGASFAYGERLVLRDLCLELAPGTCVAVLGPNGAGKSTLLRLASGALRPGSGRVLLDGRDAAALPPRERARRIALVPQALDLSFDFTVREFVGLGRTPYTRPLRGEQAADRRAIERALALTETGRFAERSLLELSGGERQRAVVALALAQEPELLLLDEPTANLDIAHQVAILELVRELNRKDGLTVLASLHDLNLAALYFDRLLMLHAGRLVADGPPRAVLTPARIEAVYASPVCVIDHPGAPVPLVALAPRGRAGAARDQRRE